MTIRIVLKEISILCESLVHFVWSFYKMFTPLFLKYYGKVLNFLYFSKATPYYWDNTAQRMRTSQKKNLWGFKFIFLTYCLYFAFDGMALWKQVKNPDRDIYGFTITFIWCFAYLWVMVIMINLWTKNHESVWIFEQLVQLDGKSQSVKKGKKESRLLEYILGLVAYAFVVGVFVWSVVLWGSMEKEGFIYSAIPRKFRGRILFAIFLLMEIWSKSVAISHIFWDQLFLLVTILVPSIWMSDETCQKRSTKEHLAKYREFQVLIINVNACHTRIKLPLTLEIMFSFLLVGYYGCFRLFGKMSLLTYLLFPAIVNNCNIVPMLILLPAARLGKISEKYLSKMRVTVLTGNKSVTKGERKELKGFWKFGIKLGYLRAIEHEHIATYFMAVTSYTISMLVAVK